MLPHLIRIVINTTKQIKRQTHLSAAPYERSRERQGHANGYKPKTVTTRVGKITFDVLQLREGGFYPQSLEKGLARRCVGWRSTSGKSKKRCTKEILNGE